MPQIEGTEVVSEDRLPPSRSGVPEADLGIPIRRGNERRDPRAVRAERDSVPTLAQVPHHTRGNVVDVQFCRLARIADAGRDLTEVRAGAVDEMVLTGPGRLVRFAPTVTSQTVISDVCEGIPEITTRRVPCRIESPGVRRIRGRRSLQQVMTCGVVPDLDLPPLWPGITTIIERGDHSSAVGTEVRGGEPESVLLETAYLLAPGIPDGEPAADSALGMVRIHGKSVAVMTQ